MCVALPVAAQGKWWQSEEYRRELRLTPEQSKRLEEVFQAAVPTLKSLKKSLDQAESEIRAARRARRRWIGDGFKWSVSKQRARS
jgi:hypothetical protein